MRDVKEQYDEFAEEYNDHYSDVESRMENAIVATIYNRHLDGGEMLDLGCGTGYFAYYLNYDHYHGIDLSGGMVEKTPDTDHATFEVGDIRNLSGESYDSIVSTFSGVGYITLNEVWRIVTENLVDGGRFALMFPSPQYLDGPYNEYELNGIRPVECFDLFRPLPKGVTVEECYHFKPVDGEPPFIESYNDQKADDYIHNILIGEYHA